MLKCDVGLKGFFVYEDVAAAYKRKQGYEKGPRVPLTVTNTRCCSKDPGAGYCNSRLSLIQQVTCCCGVVDRHY